MTLIVHALFDRAARVEEESGAEASPGALLSRVNRLIKEALGQTGADALSDDGMDCSLCRVDLAAGRLTFAGARGALYIATGGATRVVKGTPRGAGYVRTPREARFNDVDMPLEPNAVLKTTDGLVDQPGGATAFPSAQKAHWTFGPKARAPRLRTWYKPFRTVRRNTRGQDAARRHHRPGL